MCCMPLTLCSNVDIIERVKESQVPAFRPRVPESRVVNSDIMQLMLDCWSDTIHERPDFRTINKRFSDMNAGK